jgi:hypothetical protein
VLIGEFHGAVSGAKVLKEVIREHGLWINDVSSRFF